MGPGFGCVIRENKGIVEAFSCGKYDGALSAHQAELMALKDGLKLAASCGIKLESIECDVSNVVKEDNSHSFNSAFGVLDEDIVELIREVGGGSYHYIPRKSTMMTHALAALDLNSAGNLVGDGNHFPYALYDILQADLA